MARNFVKSDTAPLSGGSFGVVEERSPLSTPPVREALVKLPTKQAAVPPPKRYSVQGGPNMQHGRVAFMYDGQRTLVALGKELSEATHDIAHIQSQGITLKEI